MIICGDSLEILRGMEKDQVDLVLTSPPYYGQREYNHPGLGNEETPEEYLHNIMETFREAVRITKPTGSIVYNMGDKVEAGSLLLIPYRFALTAVESTGVKLVNDITWVKKNPTPHQFQRRLVQSTEPFFHFALGKDYYHDSSGFMEDEQAREHRKPGPNAGMGYRWMIDKSELTKGEKERAHTELSEVIGEMRRGEIREFRMKIRGTHQPAYGGNPGGRQAQMDNKGFTIIRMKGNKIKRDVMETPVARRQGSDHPARFPVRVAQEMIKLLCPRGGVVIDPYLGSGSTAEAALSEGRKWIGVEINPQYCEEARQKIGAAKPGVSKERANAE